MKDNLIVGIDIGSTDTRTIITQDISDGEMPRVLGVGIVGSVGIRRGAIINVDEVVKVINESVEKAERMAGVVVRKAIISVGGVEVSFQNSKGVIAVGRADGEVAEDDLNRVVSEVQTFNLPVNKEIIHIIPQSYRLDDQDGLKDPLGMRGVRLELNALIIEGSSAHLKNLKKCVYQAGIEIDELVLEPLAATEAVLSKKQKELGVVMINIGGGTTSLAVLEEGELLHTAILPLGAGHVTNDIAIGLRTSIEVAEKIKLEYGSAIAEGIGKKEEIDLSQIDSQEDGIVSRYHVAEIIEARMEEIFELVNKELKLTGRANLLPAGAVITGGGAKMPRVVDLAKKVLGLPAQIGYPVSFGGITNEVDDPSFATASGLVLWKINQNSSLSPGAKRHISGGLSEGTQSSVKKVRKWLEKFLP